MASFETLSAENLNRPSYGEIRDFAIHLKVRFGDEAASTADFFVQKHEESQDFLRAEIWRTVASSIKTNDIARGDSANRVNSIH